MMIKKLKLPIIMIVIGLIAAAAACLLTGILHAPTITEHEFPYAVTYRLNGEIHTLTGVYTCRFVGHDSAYDPLNRLYTETYTVDGITQDSRLYTIAQPDGSEIRISTSLNSSYLMGDTKNADYASSRKDPSLSAVNADGDSYEDEEILARFDAEILDWEYPEPIENTFVFCGFSKLHTVSMLAMLLVGIFVVIACCIWVKKAPAVSYHELDRYSIVLNFIIGLMGVPFLTLVIWLLQLTLNTDSLAYQTLLCLPAFTVFTIAASTALRRNGFKKSGFFVQFAGPAIFALYVAADYIAQMLFH